MSFNTQDRDGRYVSWWQQQQQPTGELHAMLEGLSYNSTMEVVLEYILQRSRELFHADAGAIYRLQKQEGMLHIQASQGVSASYAASMRVALGKGAVGKAVLEQRTIALSKEEMVLSTDNSEDLHIQQHKLLEEMFRCFNTLLAIPLIAKDEVYGGIVLYYTYPYEFTENTHRLAQTFGDQAALIIESARLFNEAQNKVIQEERQRMARDLHDSVIQALYGITLHTEASLRLLSMGDKDIAISYLYDIQEVAIEALQEMRLLVFELRPPVLAQKGIVYAIQARLDTVENRTGVVTSLLIEGDINLSHQIEEVLYRVVQEALNNILKHAHACTITIKLSQNVHSVQLEISDDGTGFGLSAVQRKGGSGLRSIEERITRIGGKFTVNSIPGKGTLVKAIVEI
jgi:signal transduction histidine kinase